MTGLKINLKLDNSFKNMPVPTPGQMRTAIRKGLWKSGKDLVKVAKMRIRDKSTKTGRFYRIKKGKMGRIFVHRASAPGEYPANRTGGLANSIDFVAFGHNKIVFGARKFYSKFLEDGTAKMLPRPHIKRTVESRKRIIEMYLYQEIQRRMKIT